MKGIDIDRQGDRLKASLKPKKPDNYETFPRSTTDIAAFPPPRMIHSGNFRFGYVRIYTEIPPKLLEIAACQGPILPIPPPRIRFSQPPASLATILGLE
jgi:hypothetical protein